MSITSPDISNPQAVFVAEAVNISLPPELEVNQRLAYAMRTALGAAWRAGEEYLLPLRQEVISAFKGSSPLSTKADFASNDAIYKILNTFFPHDSFISQEGAPLGATISDLKAERSWVVDALDGADGYASGNSDAYGIHIALVDHATGEPLLGVNYYPARDTTYFAIKGHGAFKQIGHQPAEKLWVNSHEKGIRAFCSTETPLIKMIYENLENVNFSKCSSCGLRICSQIDTPNNLYITSGTNTQCGKDSGPVRFTATWDIASGSVVLSEAGGILAYIDGNPIDYLASDGRLTQTVVVTSNRDLYDQIKALYLSKTSQTD